MAKARIELTGPLSLAVGRYRFVKGSPVVSTDAELIKYCQSQPGFKVEVLEEDKPQQPKPEQPPVQEKAQPASAPKPEPKDVMDSVAEEVADEVPQQVRPKQVEASDEEAS